MSSPNGKNKNLQNKKIYGIINTQNKKKYYKERGLVP